ESRAAARGRRSGGWLPGQWPPRRTVAVGATRSRSRSTAACDRCVCAMSIAALIRTIVVMSPASTTSPRKAEATAAMTRIRTSGFANACQTSAPTECRLVVVGSLGRNCARRAVASSVVSPGAASVLAGIRGNAARRMLLTHDELSGPHTRAVPADWQAAADLVSDRLRRRRLLPFERAPYQD